MSKKILCLYYSRTGKTEALMQEIAGELSCEAVKLEDGVSRSGPMGWLRSGMQAMSPRCASRRPSCPWGSTTW